MFNNQYLMDYIIQEFNNLALSMFSSARYNYLNNEENIILENETNKNIVIKLMYQCINVLMY